MLSVRAERDSSPTQSESLALDRSFRCLNTLAESRAVHLAIRRGASLHDHRARAQGRMSATSIPMVVQSSTPESSLEPESELSAAGFAGSQTSPIPLKEAAVLDVLTSSPWKNRWR
jgi:hypothetical protein